MITFTEKLPKIYISEVSTLYQKSWDEMGLIRGLNHLIQSLNDELPTYLSHADNVASETNVLQ